MGTGGSGGTSDSDGSVAPGDPCGTETMPNEDRDHATAIPVNVPAQACLQSIDDIDFYQFTIPTSPAQGGFVIVQVTDVGPDGNLGVEAFAVLDNGAVEDAHNASKGGSAFLYFAGKPGASFRLKVSKWDTIDKPTPYLLTAAFTGVNDVNEPNDDNAHATPIMVGKSVSGFFFAGLENSTDPPEAAWEDRFKVTLPAGEATIALSNIASDIAGDVTLYNPSGVQIAGMHDATNGSSVVLKHTVDAADAGECFVRIEPYFGQGTRGTGSTVPAYYKQPYSLLVTTP